MEEKTKTNTENKDLAERIISKSDEITRIAIVAIIVGSGVLLIYGHSEDNSKLLNALFLCFFAIFMELMFASSMLLSNLDKLLDKRYSESFIFNNKKRDEKSRLRFIIVFSFIFGVIKLLCLSFSLIFIIWHIFVLMC